MENNQMCLRGGIKYQEEKLKNWYAFRKFRDLDIYLKLKLGEIYKYLLQNINFKTEFVI